jgi:hypothetical protein
LDSHHILSELAQLGMIVLAEESTVEDKLTIIDTPVMINVKVIDPGQILLGKLHD